MGFCRRRGQLGFWDCVLCRFTLWGVVRVLLVADGLGLASWVLRQGTSHLRSEEALDFG